MVCNMLSTAAMVQVGKVYENLMVDMRPTNAKLAARARRIVAQAAHVDEARATEALAAASGQAKVAVVMLLAGVDADTARHDLSVADGSVRRALG
jgi:N-acetylmuramic acid 6-phosphate etherase